MSFKEFLSWYFRSVLGIASLFAGLGSAVAAVASGASLMLALAFGMGIPLMTAGVSLATGFGARQALAARDAARSRQDMQMLEDFSAQRAKLASMRVREPLLKASVDLVILAAGDYLAAARLRGRRDPLAEAALGDAIELVDLFRAEMDERAKERRFDLPDRNPFADAENRVADALKEKAGIISKSTDAISGVLPAEDRMSISEELR